MALVKSYTLKNGMTAPQAYHIVYKVDTHKRPVDDIDTYGMRPADTPEHLWKAGLYGRIGLAIYADKAARQNGKSPIAVITTYLTETPNNTFSGEHITWPESRLNFKIDLQSDKDHFEQAYDHLLLLEEYSTAARD